MADLKDFKTKYAQGDRDFSDGNFSHAQLSFQSLSQSIFFATDFSNSNLSSAQLDNCDFKNANLSFSNLSNANLSGSNLCNTNLEGANLTSATFQNAVYNDATNFPQGIDPQSLGAINIDTPEPVPEPIVEIETPSAVQIEQASTPAPIPEEQANIPDSISEEQLKQKTPPSTRPPAVPAEYKKTSFSTIPPTTPPDAASIPNTTPISQSPTSDGEQSTTQKASQQPSQSYNYTTTTAPSTPEPESRKKPNIGVIIFSALIVLTLGYCATQSTTAPSSNNQYDQPQNPFDSVGFPLRACGDAMPTNPNDYPVYLYPVFVNYSSNNLREVTSGYCRDAYRTTRENGSRAIQVASFISRDRAQHFANFMQARVGSGDVGLPNPFYK